MKHESKQRSQEQEQLAATSAQQTNPREFATTEALLRHDAAQVEVPPAVTDRLAQSLRNEPEPERSWWKRVFGR
jgi:hypothetical protein